MTNTDERTTTSPVAPVASPRPPARPWRFTAVLVLAGLVCGAFAIESLTGGNTTSAIIEASVGVVLVFAAFVGRRVRKRQAERAAAGTVSAAA